MKPKDMQLKDFEQYREDEDNGSLILKEVRITSLNDLPGGKTILCAKVPVSEFPESLRTDMLRIGGKEEDEIPVVITMNVLNPQFTDLAAYHGVPASMPQVKVNRYYQELAYSFGRVFANGDKFYELTFRELFPQFNELKHYRK